MAPARAMNGAAAGSVLLSAHGLVKRFGSHMALAGVGLDLHDGEIVVLIGPSGSGKSTLLRCLQLLEAIDEGVIDYGDGIVKRAGSVLARLGHEGAPSQPMEASAIRQWIGFVSQGYELWEERSVLGNLILAPMVVLGEDRSEAQSRAEAMCARFGLLDKMAAKAWQLSGGQRQRVAIARALMMRPRLMLFDEITASLDPLLTHEVMALLRELKASGMTMLVVTHQLKFGLSLADRVAFMQAGSIAQMATPERLVESPATAEVERFLSILQSVG